jgi:hypothetical protein
MVFVQAVKSLGDAWTIAKHALYASSSGLGAEGDTTINQELL